MNNMKPLPKLMIDADACPVPVREICVRAARRLELELLLVANQPLPRPKLARARVVTVTAGFDAADDWLVEAAGAGDVVVTADIPLAARLVAKAVHAINPRGTLYTPANIGEALSLRDFMDGMRSAGLAQSRSAPYGERDRQQFASALDRVLTQALRG